MDIKYIEKNTDTLIEYHEELDSTNERAKKIAEKYLNEIEKSEKINVVIAENQLKGKGTKGRIWKSTKSENILMTMIFYPKKNIKELDGITVKIAKMIRDAIMDLYDIQLSIKLPNDLLLNEKKISGILTESSLLNEQVNYLLVGIGFNVNQTVFPAELESTATSLKKEYANEVFKREEIVIKMINNIKSLMI